MAVIGGLGGGAGTSAAPSDCPASGSNWTERHEQSAAAGAPPASQPASTVRECRITPAGRNCPQYTRGSPAAGRVQEAAGEQARSHNGS